MGASFQDLKGRKVLVTGGAGFIGSNLCKALLREGCQVLCVDDLSTGHRSNIRELEKEDAFRFFEGDLRDAELARFLVKGRDIVLHQAARGSVPRSIEDPERTHDVNVNAFLNVLTASCEEGVSRFIYASSSSVYGDIPDMPKTEERTGAPLSPYAVSKQVNELYAKVYADLYGIEVIGLRYFNVFGANQDPEGAYAAAIPKFIQAFLKGNAPLIHGDGNQIRDFTHVSNVVQANLLAAVTKEPSALNTVYNVARGEGTSVLGLVNVLRRLLGERVPDVLDIGVEHGPARVGDLHYSQASIEKIQERLGYLPEIGLEDGLRRSLDHFLEKFEVPQEHAIPQGGSIEGKT